MDETRDSERVMCLIFEKIGLTIHPDKSFFGWTPRLEILGILFGTENQQFLLSLNNLASNDKSAARLLRYVSQHRRFVQRKDVERFIGLAKASTSAVVN